MAANITTMLEGMVEQLQRLEDGYKQGRFPEQAQILTLKDDASQAMELSRKQISYITTSGQATSKPKLISKSTFARLPVEMIEKILLQAQHQSLTRELRGVSKAFLKIIEGKPSPAMLCRMFSKPGYRSSFQALPSFPNGEGLIYDDDWLDEQDGSFGTMKRLAITIEAPSLQLAYHVPPLWRQRLVCQPPVKTMYFDPPACESHDQTQSLVDSDTGDQMVRRLNGVTLGSLFDILENAILVHRQMCASSTTCSWNNLSAIRDFGMVFQTGDPLELCRDPRQVSRKRKADQIS